MRDRWLVVAIACLIAIPMIGLLPLVADTTRPSPVTLYGGMTLDDPHAANASSILANRVTFAWTIYTVQPYKENSYQPMGFTVRAAAGSGVENVSTGTVSVVLYDTFEGRPRAAFYDNGLARYIAPLTWTDYGNDYELVSSARTGPYYLAMWLVGTIFYGDGHHLSFGDPLIDLRGIAVVSAYATLDPAIIAAAELGAGLLLLGAVVIGKNRSQRPPQSMVKALPPSAPPQTGTR